MLTVLSVIQLPYLWKASVERIQQQISQRIAAEFEQERIKSTVVEVGAREASTILHQQLEPALERVEGEAAAASQAIADAQEKVLKLEQELAERATPPTLTVDESHVDVDGPNLRFVIRLKPSKRAPIGFVNLIVNCPPDGSDVQILDMEVTGFGSQHGFIPIKLDISPGGRSAHIAVIPLVEAQFWLQVKLSGPTTLQLFGDHGLPPTDFKVLRPQ